MAVYPQLDLTAKGLTALLNAQSGAAFQITKIKMGSGTVSGSTQTLTDLVAPKVTLDISSAKTDFDGQSITVEALFDNKSLQTAFEWREVGIFFKGADGVETLYAYANATDKYDTIPANSDSRYVKTLRVKVAIGNAENITVQEAAGLVYVTQQGMVEHVNSSNPHPNMIITTDSIGAAKATDLSSHIADKNNAHGSLRYFLSPDELGLAMGTETIEGIAAAMPNNSGIMYQVSAGSNLTEYPMPQGVVIGYRSENENRVFFEFYSAATGFDKYYGIYRSDSGWSGWKGVASSAELNEHKYNKSNPHGVTAEQVGAIETYGRWEIPQSTVVEMLSNTASKNKSFVVVAETTDTAWNDVTHIPPKKETYTVFVIDKGSFISQLWISGTTNTVYISNAASDGNDNWSAWQELANAANYLPLDGSKAMTGVLKNAPTGNRHFELTGTQYDSFLAHYRDDNSGFSIHVSTDDTSTSPTDNTVGIKYKDAQGNWSDLVRIFGEHNTALLASTIRNLVEGGILSMLEIPIKFTTLTLSAGNYSVGSPGSITGRGTLFLRLTAYLSVRKIVVDGKTISSTDMDFGVEDNVAINFSKSIEVTLSSSGTPSTKSVTCPAVLY